jgi:membrane AbrB-like protein
MTAYSGVGLYLVVGAIGGLIGVKLRIPAGIMIGAMAGVIICKLLMHAQLEMPKSFGFVVQVLLGVMVASTFHPDMLKTLKSIAIPVVVSSVVLIGVGGILSLIFYRLNLLGASTAYMATSPGAMSALIAMSLEGNANAVLVTCFHFARLVFILLTAPWIFKVLSH